jgi:uncharacterized membrane protein
MLATSPYLIVFRVVHIGAAVAWGGSLLLFVMFIQPSAASVGPAGAPFMLELLGNRQLGRAILAMAAVTILGGAFLYWHDWQLYGGLGDWVGSRFGLGLTIGAVAAIIAFLIGVFGTKPKAAELVSLVRGASESGGPPSPEVGAKMGALQAQLRVLSQANLALVLVSVLTMSTARYW